MFHPAVHLGCEGLEPDRRGDATEVLEGGGGVQTPDYPLPAHPQLRSRPLPTGNQNGHSGYLLFRHAQHTVLTRHLDQLRSLLGHFTGGPAHRRVLGQNILQTPLPRPTLQRVEAGLQSNYKH